MLPPKSRRRRKTQFQSLWEKAEALAAENLKLESELDALISHIDETVVPVELELGRRIRQVVDKQLDFDEKKIPDAVATSGIESLDR